MFKAIIFYVLILLTFNASAQGDCLTCTTTTHNLNIGLVACYPFDGNANDQSGNNNHGAVNGALLAPDRFNNPNRAYRFDGIDDLINVPNSASLSSAQNTITIAFWARIEGWVLQYGVNYASTISKSNSLLNCSFRYSLTPSGVSIINGGKIWNDYSTSATNDLNNWDYYAITTNGNAMRFYKNGILVSQTTIHSSFTFDNNNSLQIAKDDPGIIDFFKGSLDEIRIYNRELSATEIEALYRGTGNLPYSINAGADFSVCKEDSFMLVGNGLGSMLWSPAALVASPTALATRAKIDANTKFVLTGTLGSCIARDTVLVNTIAINANAGPDVQICKRGVSILNGSANMGNPSWLPIRNISGNLSFNPSVNPDSNTTYILTVKSGNCTSRDTVIVSVNPLDVQIINKDTAVCLGDTITLFASTNATSFVWLNTTEMLEPFLLTPRVFPSSSQKYMIEVSDPECVIRDSVFMNIKTLNLTPLIDERICKGNAITIFGDSIFGATYEWFPKNGLATPYQRQTLASADTTMFYTLLVQHGKCNTKDSLQILVDPMPIVDAGLDVSHCYLDSAELFGSVNFADSFQWMPTTGLANAFSLGTKVSAGSTMRYRLFAYSGVCQNYDSAEVVALPKVEANFQASTYLSIAPALVQFQNNSLGSSKFNWDFGDSLGSSIDENPSYNFSSQGTYQIRLIASNALDCADTAYQTIRLGGNSEIYIPNVFTPNQDGLNNEFVVSFNPNDYEWVAYSIYNRWGALLFQTIMPGAFWWDGNYKSTQCPQGVYFYTLEAKPLGMLPRSYSGTLTLLR